MHHLNEMITALQSGVIQQHGNGGWGTLNNRRSFGADGESHNALEGYNSTSFGHKVTLAPSFGSPDGFSALYNNMSPADLQFTSSGHKKRVDHINNQYNIPKSSTKVANQQEYSSNIEDDGYYHGLPLGNTSPALNDIKIISKANNLGANNIKYHWQSEDFGLTDT
jgi:hypothetical protein